MAKNPNNQKENSKPIIEKKAYAPIIKGASGKIEIVLSDDSVDRDNEIIGKKFLERAAKSDLIHGLMDHENKALNTVCEWVNKRVEKRNGHNALVAEPRFFMSNPNAQILKNMIEKDKARLCVSITAIPTDNREVERNGKKFLEWSDGEIVSADFVGIPANKNAMVSQIAKSFSTGVLEKNNSSEVADMSDFNEEKFSKSLLEGVTGAIEKATKNLATSDQVSGIEKRVAALEKRGDRLDEEDKDKKKQALEEEEAAAQKANGSGPSDAGSPNPMDKGEQKSAKDLADSRDAKLKALPTANNGQTAKAVEVPEQDDDVSAGAFIKAYAGKEKSAQAQN